MKGFFSLLMALVVTVMIECGLSFFFKSKRLVYCVVLCNLLTNPLLNFILLFYYNVVSRENYWAVVTMLEVAAVCTEAFVIKIMTDDSRKKAWLLSLLFNASSFGIGLLLLSLQIISG